MIRPATLGFALASLVLPVTMPLASAIAEEALVVVRGTQGLTAVPLVVTNSSNRPVACTAAIAHWYSAPVGIAAPGARLSAQLWSNPATGEVFLLNPVQDRMPVQRLWCGYEGEDVSTRSEIALQRRAGAAEPAITLDCRAAGVAGAAQGLACQRRSAE